MPMKKEICFTSANFDRQTLKRSDENWITKQLNNEESLFLLFWQNKFLTNDDLNIRFLDKKSAKQYCGTRIHWKYLGELSITNEDKDTPITVFGAEIIEPTERTESANWQSLRAIGLQITPHDANLLAYTQGLLNWHSINRFCSHCGSTVEHKQAGHALVCSSKDCAKDVFPRTDPAVIVLVYHKDACLLGRAKAWPENMFSCLAGFVETGEDLKAAVRREIFEESGLMLSKIEYRGSQPWPFPQSLMLGFHAEANNREITFHDGELDDARWFTRQQILDAVTDGRLKLSSSLSISYHLIEDWFNQDSNTTLAEHLNR